MRRVAVALAALALAACLRPAEDRALADLEVGRAQAGGLTLTADDGLAHVRAIEPGAVELWAQAPVLGLTLQLDAPAPRVWTFTVRNVLADAELTGEADAELAIGALGGPRPTVRAWQVTLPARGTVRLTIAPPDADDRTPWRFAAMADIQDALDRVHEVFARIDAEPDLRFVISMGDITRRGQIWEYDLWEEQLGRLALPYYATIGNHELWGPPSRWTERFGRMNLHFRFRGVVFTLVDSGSATLDPLVMSWLDTWLAAARDDVHVFATHYPPIDPLGIRQGSFASRREAAALLDRLAAGRVDLTLYGHIHTFIPFENAGIPAFISGGGGAEPMRLDGIDRHFLVVDVDPEAGIRAVDVVRVD
jgi:3',5'-cyclic-AMP phosphodiesterase